MNNNLNNNKMLHKGPKKSTNPTPRPKSKSKSKSNPKIKTKIIDFNKPHPKPTSAKPKPIPMKLKSKDLANTIILKRQTPSRCKSRPKSSLSNTFKKPLKQKEYYKFNVNDLVTEEDLIKMSEQNQFELLPTLSKNLERVNFRKRSNEEEAATLIQKTWRGFKTRKIIKHYINLYKKIDDQSFFKKAKSGSATKKKDKQKNKSRNDEIMDRIERIDRKTIRSRYQININMNINISPVQQYSFYSDQQAPLNKTASIKSISIESFNEGTEQKQGSSNLHADPMLRVAELQLGVIRSRQEQQLQNLQSKFNNKKISKNVYEHKRQNIVNTYEQEKRKLLKSKSQLSFGFLKVPFSAVYPEVSKLKSKSYHSEERLLINKINKINLSELQNNDDAVSLDLNFSYEPPKEQKPRQQLQPTQKTQHVSMLIKPPIPFVSSLFEDDIEQINTSDIENLSIQSQEIQIARQHVDYIEQVVENSILDQLAIQLYLNPSVSKQLSSFFDLTHISKFQRITNQDISDFIDLMLLKFRPNDSDLLKRLNQKINPTALELLRILRNEEGEMDDEFYELVIPEKNFKDFREWREKEPKVEKVKKPKKNKVVVVDLQDEKKCEFEQKEKEYNEKKIRMDKFEKDLHAMYYKAIFNCLNEAIVQTKCSYSPINGRSTIGPGQLKVSLLDSNTEVQGRQIHQILKKSKDVVMRNFRYSCPSLDIVHYDSVFKFQEVLMKQLHEEIEITEHRWISFFDQYLEIAMEIYNIVLDQLVGEAVKEMYWKVWRR